MKIHYCFIVCVIIKLLLFNSLKSQDQSLISHHVIPANNEHDTIRFGLMLPPSYNSANQSYPTIYFLHGLNGYYAGWQAQSIAKFIKTHAEQGNIPESVVVFPDGEEGFWCNHYDKDPLLEDEIIHVLIPYIDKNYSTDVGKRMIIGWSSGGMGAMILFSKHPKSFKASISLDGSIVNWDDFLNFQGNRTEIIGNRDYYNEYCSPHKWAERNKKLINVKQDTAMFLAAGMLAPYTQEFLNILENQETPFYFQELACGHEFACVFAEVEEALLNFLSKTLQ